MHNLKAICCPLPSDESKFSIELAITSFSASEFRREMGGKMMVFD